MVVAHDPVYPIKNIPDLAPCADGAGIVEEIGDGSVWKVGQRVMLMSSAWLKGDVPTLQETKSLGAGDVQGTLREYAVVVSEGFSSYLRGFFRGLGPMLNERSALC